jgi:hypothetical protein
VGCSSTATSYLTSPRTIRVGGRSARALAEAAEHTTLIINPIIYAEVSIGDTTIEALDAVLPAALHQRESIPWEAGFLAGKSFVL